MARQQTQLFDLTKTGERCGRHLSRTADERCAVEKGMSLSASFDSSPLRGAHRPVDLHRQRDYFIRFDECLYFTSTHLQRAETKQSRRPNCPPPPSLALATARPTSWYYDETCRPRSIPACLLM